MCCEVCPFYGELADSEENRAREDPLGIHVLFLVWNCKILPNSFYGAESPGSTYSEETEAQNCQDRKPDTRCITAWAGGRAVPLWFPLEQSHKGVFFGRDPFLDDFKGEPKRGQNHVCGRPPRMAHGQIPHVRISFRRTWRTGSLVASGHWQGGADCEGEDPSSSR